MYKFCLVVFLSVSCLAGPVENNAQQEASATTLNAPPPSAVPQVVEDVRSGRSYARNSAVVEESLLQNLNSKCAKRDPSSCAALKIVATINRLLKKESIGVADNIEITQTSPVADTPVDIPRSISQGSEESQMAALISSKILSFVRSRALRLRLLPDLEAVITSKPDGEGNLNLGMRMEKVPIEEGRGKQKQMGGLMAAMVMKAGMLAAMAFKGLVLLVGKALLISKIALLLAVILGLKKLFSSNQKHVTYEVVAQPHHSHAHIEHLDHGHSVSGGGGGGGGGGHDSYSSGWGRSSDYMRGDAHRLAYRGYAPKL